MSLKSPRLAYTEKIVQTLSLLRRLVNEGHTVVVIEHDTELISSADYVIEMGPKGGIQGGNKIFQGIPRDLITCLTIRLHI